MIGQNYVLLLLSIGYIISIAFVAFYVLETTLPLTTSKQLLQLLRSCSDQVTLRWAHHAQYHYQSHANAAIHRTLIDACRTMLVWGVDLVIFYAFNAPAFGEPWNNYSYLQACDCMHMCEPD